MNLPVKLKTTPTQGDEPAVEEQAQYLTFFLGKEMFAIGILNIREILEFGQPTVVPMMPDFIRGVINLRGAVVPVVDLAARFGGEPGEVNKRSCIVILEVEGKEEGQEPQKIGIVVDAVSAVLEIARENIEPAPAFGAKIRTDFIAGMGKVDGKFVIILDVEQVLSVEDMALIDHVARQSDANETE